MNRKLFMGSAMLAVMVVACTFALSTHHSSAQKKKDKELSEAELKEAYAKTEEAVSKGSTNDRPGLAAWSKKQGTDLTWPAKYYLPWPAGQSHQVFQSWNGNKVGPPRATHMKAQNYYAWDFNIVRGQYICAARDGEVSFVHDSEPAGNENDNVIRIKHNDGEVSVYAHIGSSTSLVEVGDKVLTGQKICQGSNESIHLHFVIWKGMIDYPCRFLDYTANNGVPQGGSSVVSGNKGTEEAVLEQIRTNYKKGEAAFAEKDYLNALKWFRAATVKEVLITEYEQSLERIEECRGLIDAEVDKAINEAKSGDFVSAEKRFKALKKQYGDYAGERIDEALDELKDDPKFQEWVAKQRAGRLWVEAEKYYMADDWDKAIDAYKKLTKMYEKNTPQYKKAKSRLRDCLHAKILEE